jgi:hypothetical protein
VVNFNDVSVIGRIGAVLCRSRPECLDPVRSDYDQGYFMAGANSDVDGFGGARSFGLTVNLPVVAIAAT